MIKYFIVFENINIPFKFLGYKLFEKININEFLINDYFK